MRGLPTLQIIFGLLILHVENLSVRAPLFLTIPVMLAPMTAAWLARLLGWPCSQYPSVYLNLTGIILLEQDFIVFKFLI